MTVLGRAFGLSPKLTSLLSIGAAICGVSAIIAARGAIDAGDEDASYAIAAILALGAISLVAFPLIGHALGMSDHAYGLWVGLAVDNTAEATAAGALYSEAAGRWPSWPRRRATRQLASSCSRTPSTGCAAAARPRSAAKLRFSG